MWLEDADESSGVFFGVVSVSECSECCFYFCGVVAVVVDDGDVLW